MRPTPNCSAGFGFNGVWVAGQRTLRKLLERGRAKIPHNFAFQSAKRRPVAQCIKINNKQKQFIFKKISYVYSFSVVDNIFQSVWLYVCYKLLYIPKEKHIRGKRISFTKDHKLLDWNMKKVSVVVFTLQISFLHLCLEVNTFIAKMARSLVSTKYLK